MAETRPTLVELIEVLGPSVLRVDVAPAGMDAAVGEVVIWDVAERPEIESGDVVLAVGVAPSSADTVEFVERAGRAGASAVVLKLDADASPALRAAALSAGTALLAVAPEVGWGRLHTLLRTARSATGAPVGGGFQSVPLGDLFALADAVAAMVGGATTIEDRHSTVLAYSSADHPLDEPRRQTILGHRVPDTWMERLRQDGVFRRLWTEPDVVHVDYQDDGFLPRRAVAVRAGGEVLGSIWVAQGAEPFGPGADAALLDAAEIAALHLIRHRSSEDLERHRRSELLRAVLEGKLPAAAALPSLGFADESVAVLAFEIDTSVDTEVAVVSSRAVDLVSLYCEAHRRQAACVAIGRVVYVLLPGADRLTPERLVALGSDIVDRTGSALRVGLRVGIGSPVPSLASVGDSRWEADQVLRALAGDPDAPPVAHVDDVRSRVVLLSLRDLAAGDRRLMAGKVARFAAREAEKAGAFLETLAAYLDAFGDARVAADALHIHPNTLRYRLRRVVELTGLDLDDPTERLVAHLQLKLSGGLGPGGARPGR